MTEARYPYGPKPHLSAHEMKRRNRAAIAPSEAEQERRDEERMHEIIMAASEHDLDCGCTDCTVDDREVFYG